MSKCLTSGIYLHLADDLPPFFSILGPAPSSMQHPHPPPFPFLSPPPPPPNHPLHQADLGNFVICVDVGRVVLAPLKVMPDVFKAYPWPPPPPPRAPRPFPTPTPTPLPHHHATGPLLNPTTTLALHTPHLHPHPPLSSFFLNARNARVASRSLPVKGRQPRVSCTDMEMAGDSGLAALSPGCLSEAFCWYSGQIIHVITRGLRPAPLPRHSGGIVFSQKVSFQFPVSVCLSVCLST